MVFSLLTAAASAYAPMRPVVSSRTHGNTRLAASGATRGLDADSTAILIRNAAAMPTMYALMSLNEYMTHRYFQVRTARNGPCAARRARRLAPARFGPGPHSRPA